MLARSGHDRGILEAHRQQVITTDGKAPGLSADSVDVDEEQTSGTLADSLGADGDAVGAYRDREVILMKDDLAGV